jgi:hypothetical protein
MWRIFDRERHAAAVAAVEELRTDVIRQLELDLQTAQSRLDACNSTPAAGTKRRVQDPVAFRAVPAMLPPGSRRAAPPTFDEVKQRMQLAERRQSLATVDDEATDDRDPDSDPFARRSSKSDNIWKRSKPASSAPTSPTSAVPPPTTCADSAKFASNNLPCARHLDNAELWAAARTAARADATEALLSAATPAVRSSVQKLLSRALQEMTQRTSTDRGESSRGDAGGPTQHIWQVAERESRESAALSGAAADTLAAAIEAAVLTSFSGDAASHGYRDRCRSIIHAIRDPLNASLLASIASGALAPSVLAEIPVESLRNPQQRAAARAMQTAAASEATIGGNESWLPATYVCSYCKSSDTELRDSGTGTADCRKAEIWGSATAIEAFYRVRCRMCGSEWVRNLL